MQLLKDPNVAYAAVTLGLLIGYIEFLRPGTVVPGVCGAVLTMLGIAALAGHSLHWQGLALMAAAATLTIAEAKWGCNGLAALAGAGAMTLGARLLTGPPRIGWWVAAGLSAPLVAVTSRLLAIAFLARTKKLLP